MALINEAYLILSDEEARSRYDQEYYCYSEFNSQRYSDFNSHYSVKDDILRDWMNKAKAQAKSMRQQSLDELLGVSKAAFTAAKSAALKASIKYIFLFVIFLLLSMVFGR